MTVKQVVKLAAIVVAVVALYALLRVAYVPALFLMAAAGVFYVVEKQF